MKAIICIKTTRRLGPTRRLLPILLPVVLVVVVPLLLVSFPFDGSRRSSGHSNGIGSPDPVSTVPNHRTSALDPTGEFSFIHISKAAGASWIESFLELPLDVCPKAKNLEYSVWFQTSHNRDPPQKEKRGGCKGANYNTMSLQSPRHHVWSMFSMCKHSGWGQKITKNTTFPRSGKSPEDDIRDIEVWLDHFLPMDNNHVGCYNCFHAANHQSRHLDAKVRMPHCMADMPDDEYRFEPNLNNSLATCWNQDFVAIVELLHESSCLMYFRLGSEAPPKAIRYLDQKCRCPPPVVDDETLKTKHVMHHKWGHRGDLRRLPHGILRKIEKLTRVDRELYLVALKELLNELAWLESPLALGRRVLCEDTLDKWELELTYLDVSFRSLYKKAPDALLH